MQKSKKKKSNSQKQMLKAVNHRDGNLQIIACAGSGKTETISRRTANMVKDGINPGSIIAFTFTDKAAEELRGRIRRRIQEICPGAKNTGDMSVGTIHSFCRTLLQKYEPLYATYNVIDKYQQFILVQREFYNLHLRRIQSYMGFYSTIADFINACNILREEEISLDEVRDAAPDLADCIDAYQELLDERRLLDYSGMMAEAVKLLRKRLDVLAKVRADYEYVIVDEYQDVNPLQESLLQLLCGMNGNLAVVGDDDQAIYQWRGTDVQNMLTFSKRYKPIEHATLEENHRSTEGILELANNISALISARLPKTMRSEDKNPKPSLKGEIGKASFFTQAEEARFIVDRIGQLVGTEFADRDGPRPLVLADFAVLYRSLKYAKPLLRELDRRRAAGAKLDYNVSGVSGLLERLEARAVMTIFSYMCDENDQSLVDVANSWGRIPSEDDLGQAISASFGLKSRDIRRSLKKINILKARFHDGRYHSLQVLYQEVLESIEIHKLHMSDGENEGLLYNLAQLSKAIADFESMYGRVKPSMAKYFIRFMWNYGVYNYEEGGKDDPTRVNAITIMTVHRAKGTEFPVVFLPCLTSGKFPSSLTGRRGRWLLPRSLFSAARYEGCDDDERRLFYVGVTRSKRYLYLTHADQIEGLKRSCSPSTFFYSAKCSAMQEGAEVTRPLGLSKTSTPILSRDTELNLSFSQLNSYLRCGWDYKFRHVFGFEPRLVEELGYGEAVHAVLLAVHNEWKDGRKVSDKRLHQLVDQQLFLPYASPEAKDALKEVAFHQVRSYRDKKESTSTRVRATEKEFEYVSEGAVIRGKIDLLENLDKPGEVKVVDFKAERVEKLTQRHNVQLGIYADAALQSLDLKPIEVAIYSLPGEREFLRPVETELVEGSKKYIRGLVAAIGSRTFECRPAARTCRDCDFGRICSKRVSG